jgi:two-component system cell cycle sensor histidine kinase/response regulator CckA
MLRFPRFRSAKETEDVDLIGPVPSDVTVILLCEDEPAVRSLFAMTLRREGYHVLEARNGADALEVMAAAGRVDLVVTDVVMPIMRGTELADRLREQQPDMHFIFISGYLMDDNLGRNAQMIQKPFKKDELIRRIVDVVGPGKMPPPAATSDPTSLS